MNTTEKTAEKTPERAPKGLTKDNVQDAFEYHPWNQDQERRGVAVREALVNATKIILDNVPDSPDRSVAVRKLREARMDCNSAITHDGKY